MPTNSKEEQKCLEKLNQMEKFLPFLDFMIDKIKKKNTELSLECQLGKFQNLKSMIKEKSPKHAWNSIIKVEEIIQKLMIKLDYKEENNGEPNEFTGCVTSPKNYEELTKASDLVESASNKDSSVSILPSSTTTTICFKNDSNLSNVKPQNFNTNNKIKSVDSRCKNDTASEKGKQTLESSVRSQESGEFILRLEISEKKEINVEKPNLSDFELTEVFKLPNEDICVKKDPKIYAPKINFSHKDLLATSRLKLMKSVENKFNLAFNERFSSHASADNNSKSTSVLHGISAFDYTREPIQCAKNNSECDIANNKLSSEKNKVLRLCKNDLSTVEKPLAVSYAPPKDIYSNSLVNTVKLHDNVETVTKGLKQSLKEKLSAGLNELYKMSGTSVGGALRLLKDPTKAKHISGEMVSSNSDTANDVRRVSAEKDCKQNLRSREKLFTPKGNHLSSQKNLEKRIGRPREEQFNINSNIKDFRDIEEPIKSKEESHENVYLNKNEKFSKSNNEKTSPKINRLNDDESLEVAKENVVSHFRAPSLFGISDSKAVNSPLKKSPHLRSEIGDVKIEDGLQNSQEPKNNAGPLTTARNDENAKFCSAGFNKQFGHVNKKCWSTTSVAQVENSKIVENNSVAESKKRNNNSSGFKLRRQNAYIISNNNMNKELKCASEVIEKTNPHGSCGQKEPSSVTSTMAREKGQASSNSGCFNERKSSTGEELWVKSPMTFKQSLKKKPSKKEQTLRKQSSNRVSHSATAEKQRILNVDGSNKNPTRLLEKTSKNHSESTPKRYGNSFKTEFPKANHPGKNSGLQGNSYKPPDGDRLRKSCDTLGRVSQVNAHKQDTPNLSEASTYAQYKKLKKKTEESRKQFFLKENKKEANIVSSNKSPDVFSKPLLKENSECSEFLPQKVKDSHSQSISTAPPSNVDEKQLVIHQPEKKELLTNSNSKTEKKFAARAKNCRNQMKKNISNAKPSSDSVEIISPLDNLYDNEIGAETERSYNLRNFKIPKKNQLNNEKIKPKENGEPIREEAVLVENKVVDKIDLRNQRNPRACDQKKGELAKKDSVDIQNAEDKETSLNHGETATENRQSDPIIMPETKNDRIDEPDASIGENKTDSSPDSVREKSFGNDRKLIEENVVSKEDEMKNSENNVTTGSTPTNENSQIKIKGSEENCDKTVAKVEITQELLEKIEKSFQSNEEKLLLAQAELFKKLTRKLNFKKLKSIQKIMYSDSEQSSESDSDSESKAYKKGVEKDLKFQKREKKRYRKIRKLDSSSSSEVDEKGQEESSSKKMNDTLPGEHHSGLIESMDCEQKTNLLEKIGEKFKSNSEANVETFEKNEPRRKVKFKQKSKNKSELDRLHDDIRNMFICSGVITATGMRMCRTTKTSDGTLKNSNFAKENLKEAQPRPKSFNKKSAANKEKRNFVNYSSDSVFFQDPLKKELLLIDEDIKSHVSTEGRENRLSGPVVKPENFFKQPFVAMNKLDLDSLDTWKYNVNVSEEDAKLCRRNAREGGFQNFNREPDGNNSLFVLPDRTSVKNIFLLRNLRKHIPLSEVNGNIKKVSKNRTLESILKRLPLKSSKEKRVSRVSRAGKSPVSSSVYGQSLLHQNNGIKIEKTDGEIFSWSEEKDQFELSTICNHALEKNRNLYSCLLCPIATDNISFHYKQAHPKSEVLISRLSVLEAKKAVEESRKTNYEKMALERNSSADSDAESKVKETDMSSSYCCRFCGLRDFTEFYAFLAHVIYHTGEYEFDCPKNGCIFTGFPEEALKYHEFASHEKKKSRETKIWSIFPGISKLLIGYLCSECNYVQVSIENMEAHLKKNHRSHLDAKMIAINMSENDAKYSETSIQGSTARIIDNDLERSRKHEPTNQNTCLGDGVHVQTQSTKRKINNNKNRVELSVDKSEKHEEDRPSSRTFAENTANESENRVKIGEEQETEGGFNEMPESVEDEAISGNLGKAMDDDKLTYDLPRNSGSKTISRPVRRLKVGPLEAQILDNSVILYECFVKGCLFSTKIFDLFEKHVKISHSRTKWNGNCEVCSRKIGSRIFLTSYKLIYALSHLRHHEKHSECSCCKTQNIHSEPLNKCDVDVKIAPPISTAENENKSNFRFQNPAGGSYPPVPLLRVRNLIGDRLSTTKKTEHGSTDVSKGVIHFGENPLFSCISSAVESVDESAPAMFTIENVRSLNPNSASEGCDSEINKVNPFAESNEIAQDSKGIAGKPVVIRSCPSRKIAIRPDNNALPVEVSHLKMVSTSSVTPVVLNSLTNTQPIRILSTLPNSASTSRFTVQPVMVSVPPSFFTTSKAASVIVPISSTPLATTAMTATTMTPGISVTSLPIEPVSGRLQVSAEENARSPENVLSLVSSTSREKSSQDVLTCDDAGSLSKQSTTKVHRSNEDALSSWSQAQTPAESQQTPASSLQKFRNSGPGNKIFKDTEIYKEMLVKKKLCHLFKCMAIECSFSCNDRNVFTQHIGLHEAQRRVKNSKSWNTNGVDSKWKKASNWYQCAYCCEVLSNSSSALGQHIATEHGHCIYQCAYCFYRAVSLTYVEIHQSLAHSRDVKAKSHMVYKCRSVSCGSTESSAVEKQSGRQSIRPYLCGQCGHKFFVTQEFLNHMLTEHQSVTAYTCHICKNLCFKADRLINHYKLHSYCTYQCAYCLHGTETEKEMLFHLCNFHFGQKANMYVRVLAENQKLSGYQLDSLKVITYENEKSCDESIIQDESDDESPDDLSKNTESADINAIIAELGISIEPGSTAPSESNADAKNDRISERSISSASFSINEKTGEDVSSVPLGQLNFEMVSVSKALNSEACAPSEKTTPTDKSLKYNEILVNYHHKEKSSSDGPSDFVGSNEEKSIAAALHKLPPMVLSRMSTPKNVYPPKSMSKCPSHKKGDESKEGNGSLVAEKSEARPEKVSDHELPMTSLTNYNEIKKTTEPVKTDEEILEMKNKQPLITNIVSLSSKTSKQNIFVKSDESSSVFPKISKIHSLSRETSLSEESKNIELENRKSIALEPPIIRVEDYSFDDEAPSISKKTEIGAKTQKSSPEFQKNDSLGSPEIVILEEDKTDKVLTVTIDSDDEREVNPNEKLAGELKDKSPVADDSVIRKEMEKLRNQIVSETDCLLFDESKNDGPVVEQDKQEDKTLIKEMAEIPETSAVKEECDLSDRKLEAEEKTDINNESKDDGVNAEEARSVPRTRSSTKEKAKKQVGGEKSDNDASVSFSEPGKKDNKYLKEGLSGKDLYICGNEKCSFSAEEDLQLKDHLYVCDLSRETSFLMCPHCLKPIKQFNTYIGHLKHHGKKKFECGLCRFASAVDTSVTRHMKQKHKCDQLKSVYSGPPKEGHVIFYPKSHKLDKEDFEIDGYSPGDEDKLPLQAVYQVNVKCAKCPYFTKVRSNMVRHLKIHVKSAETEGVVIVPSTAPTNPVPCLDTKERMFDKMTNLAASSQLAQAKEKIAIEALAPEDEAKLPQFVTEQMRYKCCLSDCNYITVDEGMLKHHMKALHGEITHYNCPHCTDVVSLDVRKVPLDKIGYHLKLHDAKMYKCPYCAYFHYQKAVVEKHTLEKHADRRYYVHTVREPQPESLSTEESSAPESSPKGWKCGLCDDCQSLSKVYVSEHLAKIHSIKSKYKCQLCDMKSNHHHSFFPHFASKHPGEKVKYMRTMEQVSSSTADFSPAKSDSSGERFDTTPLWQRGAPRIRHIRGILIEEEEIRTKKSKKMADDILLDSRTTETGPLRNAFYCPLCSNKKTFTTRNAQVFRSHLYQELNFHQYACILCGKMFVDKKDYERHHGKFHPNKTQALKQTKEDRKITLWVDNIIAEQRKEMESKKRKSIEEDSNSPKKKKKCDRAPTNEDSH